MKPELNLSNEEIGLLSTSLLAFKGNAMNKLALAGSKEEADFCVMLLNAADTLANKFKTFTDELNKIAEEEKKAKEKAEADATVKVEDKDSGK